jgi:hypothetical protein
MEHLFEKVINKYEGIHYYNDENGPMYDEITGLRRPDYSFKGVSYNRFQRIHNEEMFLKHYGDPNAEVNHTRTTIKVEKDGSKISIKLFHYGNGRRVQSKWFKKQTKCDFLTYNIEKNSLYIGHIINYHKKRKFKKYIRRVVLNQIVYTSIGNALAYHLDGNVLECDLKKIDGETFLNILNENVPGLNVDSIEFVVKSFGLLCAKKSGIKLPNNIDVFLNHYPQPNSKVLKKHKNKYIDALMYNLGMKGDKVKKVLHLVNKFNYDIVREFFNEFGYEYLLQKPYEDIVTIFNNSYSWYAMSICHTLSKKEKDNYYNLVIDALKNDYALSSIFDHVRYYHIISKYEKIKWVSNDLESFQDEHIEWSNKVDFYTRGKYTRIYDQNFIDMIEDKIYSLNGSVYHPVVLKNTEEYNIESFKQHNCVKTYADRPKSIIISLRKGEDGEERATIEYLIMPINKTKFSLHRVQTLGKFNKGLDQSWEDPIQVLDNRIDLSCKCDYFKLPQVIYKTGHKEFKRDLIVKEDKLKYYVDFSGVDLMGTDDRLVNDFELYDINFDLLEDELP